MTPRLSASRTTSVSLGQAVLQRADSLTVLADKHMAPGGINEQLMTDLRRDCVPDVVRRALDRMLARLRE